MPLISAERRGTARCRLGRREWGEGFLSPPLSLNPKLGLFCYQKGQSQPVPKAPARGKMWLLIRSEVGHVPPDAVAFRREKGSSRSRNLPSQPRASQKSIKSSPVMPEITSAPGLLLASGIPRGPAQARPALWGINPGILMSASGSRDGNLLKTGENRRGKAGPGRARDFSPRETPAGPGCWGCGKPAGVTTCIPKFPPSLKFGGV